MPMLFPTLDTPALRIDLDKLERNLREMAEAASARGVSLRPHFKTHKTVEIARMQLELGAIGITTAPTGAAPTPPGCSEAQAECRCATARRTRTHTCPP